MTKSSVPVDHTRMEVLGYRESMDLLASVPVGRVAFVEGGEPVVFPINHLVDGRTVVFRTAYGSKWGAAWHELPAAFEADQFDANQRTGWSILLRGTLEPVDEDESRELDARGLDSWADAIERPHWVRLRPNQVTGRRIRHPE